MSKNEQNKLIFSVILAFRNEASFLRECLDSFDNQSLPWDQWEMILVDGLSEDGSELIAREYCERHENCKLLNNPKKLAVSGWNIGVNASSGRYFHLASGHSVTDSDFLLRAKAILISNPEIYALGGRIYKIGLDSISKGISAAMNTPLAMGGSYYRIGIKTKQVNGIGLGIYLKNLVDLIGSFDSSIGRTGDWEFDCRICSNGYNIYFSPELIVKVFSRSGYISTFRQMFRTGFWKVKVWAKHPRSLLIRHIVPSVFIVILLAMPLANIVLKNNVLYILWTLVIVAYLIVVIVGTKMALVEKARWYFIMPTFPTVHIAYGLGFLSGLVWWGKYFLRNRTAINVICF